MKRPNVLTLTIVALVITSGGVVTTTFAGSPAETEPCNSYTAMDEITTVKPDVTITTLSGMPEQRFSFYYNSDKQSLDYTVSIDLPDGVYSAMVKLPKYTTVTHTGSNVSLVNSTGDTDTVTITKSEGEFTITSNKTHIVQKSKQFSMFTPSVIYANIPDIMVEYNNQCVNIASYESDTTMRAENGTINHSTVTYYKISETESFETFSVSANGTTVTFVKPEQMNLSRTTENNLTSYTRLLLQNYTGFPNYIKIHVVPSDMSGASGIHVPQGEESSFIWINSNVEPEESGNVLAHELTHSRQSYDSLGTKMEWFTEASAEYLATDNNGTKEMNLEPIALDPYGEDYRNYKKKPVLSKPSTWKVNTQYKKGGVVLYHLDKKLQKHNYSVNKLLLWMNEKEGKITYHEVREKIKMESNESVAEWFDKYVKTTAIPRTEPDESLD